MHKVSPVCLRWNLSKNLDWGSEMEGSPNMSRPWGPVWTTLGKKRKLLLGTKEPYLNATLNLHAVQPKCLAIKIYSGIRDIWR